MNYAPALLPSTPPAPPALPRQQQPACSLTWHTQALASPQAVHVLDFRRNETALLEVEHGRAWVTCDGRLEDYFLEPGQRLSFTGPVRLRVSAEGGVPQLRWACAKP